MTAAVLEFTRNVRKAVDTTERRFNRTTSKALNDSITRRERIHQMAREGMSSQEIADALGMSQRHVSRARSQPVPDNVILLPTAAHEITDERAEELEAVAGVVLDLACRIRDENPVIVAESLWSLSHWDLVELAIAAVAAIDIDSTKAELFAWVEALPAAQETRHD